MIDGKIYFWPAQVGTVLFTSKDGSKTPVFGLCWSEGITEALEGHGIWHTLGKKSISDDCTGGIR